MDRLIKIGIFIMMTVMSSYIHADNTATIQLIRSATLKINYGGLTFLVDPMLSDKGELETILGINHNPIIRLPIPIKEICEEVNYVICTHTHFDHYDGKAAEVLNRIPTICQPTDTTFFRHYGISGIPVDTKINIGTVKLVRTTGKHGRGELAEVLGPVSGFIIQSPELPSIYIVGDCVLTDEIIATINKYTPDYIVLNSGGAINPALDARNGAFLMNEKDVVETVRQSPDECRFIAVHMEALDHCQTNRTVLKDEAKSAGIKTCRLLVPEDGETIVLSR